MLHRLQVGYLTTFPAQTTVDKVGGAHVSPGTLRVEAVGLT